MPEVLAAPCSCATALAVAALDGGQRGFQRQDRLGARLRIRAIDAREGEHALDMRDIGLADLGETRVRVEVVVAIRQAKTTHAERGQVAVRILAVGAQADAVSEVLDLPAEAIEPPPRLGMKLKTEFIRGMGKKDEQFIIILDIDRIFSSNELALLHESEAV